MLHKENNNVYNNPREIKVALIISINLCCWKLNFKLKDFENPRIISEMDDAIATLVYGIEIDQSKIHIVIKKIIDFLFVLLKMLDSKNGRTVKGEKERIETIIAFGPMKLRKLEILKIKLLKSLNLLSPYRIGSIPKIE